MPRLEAIQNSSATGKSKQLLDTVQKKLGMTPNLMRTFANSPAVLDAYLNFSGALSQGVLPAKLREQIALVVGQANQCDYCLSAHSAIGKMVGLSQEEILDNRQGMSTDPRVEAALGFVQQVVDKRGFVNDDEFERLRDAGYSDEEITEIIGNVALNFFTNYFNHIAQTEVDFPVAPAIENGKHASTNREHASANTAN